MTRSRRTVAALVLTAVVALLPAACGSDDSSTDYCATAKRYQSVFSDDGTGLSLVTNISKLKKIAALAPDDLQDEWQTFLSALEGLDQAITSVGLKPADFVDAVPPAGINAAAKATIATAANRLAQSDVVDAASGIEQQAKDVCKLQFGL